MFSLHGTTFVYKSCTKQGTPSEVNHSMHTDSIEGLSKIQKAEKRKILVVGNEGVFTEDLINYAINLALRIERDLLALSVQRSSNGAAESRRAAQSAELFRRKAKESGVGCELAARFGDMETALEDLHRGVNRIELIVADSRIKLEEVSREITIPIYTVTPNLSHEKGARVMSEELGSSKRKPWVQTAGFGLATVAMYAAVFANADTVMHYFTKGGWHAALPIGTVFLFSFVHGAFASNLWSLLGIEAMKKDALRETEKAVAQKRKQARKRPRAYAYVNPFHRI
jgi:uncharacterized integral membrane protein